MKGKNSEKRVGKTAKKTWGMQARAGESKGGTGDIWVVTGGLT